MGEETGGSRDDPSPQEVFTAGHFMRPAALLLAVPNHSWWLPVPGGLGRVPPMCGFPIPLCRPHARAAPRPGFTNLSSKWGSCENILRAGPSFLMNWPGASSSPPLQQEGCRQLPSPPPRPRYCTGWSQAGCWVGRDPKVRVGEPPGRAQHHHPKEAKPWPGQTEELCVFFSLEITKSPPGEGWGQPPRFPALAAALGSLQPCGALLLPCTGSAPSFPAPLPFKQHDTR